MSTPDILQTPQIQPFQFSNDGNEIDNTVNLFRGDVNFYIPLVSLTGRNGLDLQVSALYRSNVSEQTKNRNLTAPTSILGLGWELPTDRIEVDTNGTGTQDDNKYFFIRNETRNRLYRNNKLWLRGVLDSGFVADLDNQQFSQAILAALLSQGLRIDASSTVLVITSGENWVITDPVNEYELNLVLNQGSDIQVYDGGKSYELQGYDFSRIRYYPKFERWEITYTNGITNVFGGNIVISNQIKSSKFQAIQWGVQMDNWQGASMITHSSSDPSARIQSQFAKAWNFVISRTIWNDQVVFEYDQVLQMVGVDGLPYTKACYLKKITDVFERTVEFSYKEKTYDRTSPQSPREYADPNKAIPNSDADAFQSCYQTRYLDKVEVLNEAGDVLYALNFSYDLARYTATSSNDPYLYGDTFKRTLLSISKTLGTGHSFPNIDLVYYSSADTHPGALKSITYAEGSTVTYTYSKNELANCSRNLKISNPTAGSTPRVWFGEDFAVVTWYSQGKLAFAIYTWIGRWQIWTPQVSSFNDFIDLDAFFCEIQDDFVVLYYKNANGQTYSLRAFHKDPRIIGSWIEYSKNPIVVSSTDCQVAAGENFFVIADRVNYKVNTYTWAPLSRQWNEAPLLGYQPPATPGSTMLFMSGTNNILIFLSYDKLAAPGHKDNRLTLYYLDELGQWHIGDNRIATEISIDQNNLTANFTWSSLPWAMTATYVTDSSASSLNYNLSIYQWSAADYQFKEPVTTSLSLQKSEPSADITIPYVADCSSSGLISSGPNLMRFNGETWLTNNNLKIEQQALDGTIFWFAVGPDFVVKSENSTSRVIGMVQVFDPNTQTIQWQEQAIELFDTSPVGDRLIQYFPTAAKDYLTWNYDIYARGTSTDWITPLKNPAYSIPMGSDTTTLINQGPNFMVYLIKSSDFKTILGTEVVTMTNGQPSSSTQINERYFSLVASDGHFVANVEGKMPGGLNSFLTYLPLDKDFSEATSITLYRYLGQSLEDPIVSYPATLASVSDGFQTVNTHYKFDADSAACDFQGAVAKYYQTTVSKGEANKNGYSVYHFFNSLNGVTANKSNLTESTFLDGTLTFKGIYDASGKLVSSVETDTEVITSIAGEPGSEPDTPIFGAIVQVSKSTQVKDGVTSVTTYVYNPASGSVCDQSLSAYNALGQLEVQHKLSIYGFEAYSELWYLNNLGPIIQTKTTTTIDNGVETVVTCKATTVKGFDVPLPGAGTLVIADLFETYLWLGGNESSDFNFALWSSGTGYPDYWFKNSSITIRSEHGLIMENEAPIGKTHSSLYTSDESVEVATFSNASIQGQEAYYYGFETYENPGLWKLDNNTPIVDTISYSGTRCLNVPPGKQGLPLALTPANKQREYILTFWAKPAPNYDKNAPAGWDIEFFDGNTLLKRTTVEMEASDTWEFYFQPLDLKEFSAASITVKSYPFNKGQVNVYFDNVGFSPYENPIQVSVYENVYYHVTEELGPYNATLRRRYDSLGRIIGQTDDTNGLVRVVSPFLSRQVNGALLKAEPNSLVNFQPMGDTLVDRFYNNGDYSANWSPSDSAKWESRQGYLIYNSTGPGTIQLSNPSFPGNYVAHVGFSANETITNNLGLTVGDDLTIQWLPGSKKWQLVDHKNTKTLDCAFVSVSPEEDWVLALSRDCVFFFVEGRLAFSYVPTHMVAGAFGLFVANKVRFNNFLIGMNPQIAAKFLNGSGKDLQGQSMEGVKVTVTQTVYDDIGRPAVTTQPATLDTGSSALLAYRADAVTALDWQTGIMQGAIADKLPDDEGYPYSRKVFEPSPLGRVKEIGAPGKDFAVTSANNPHTVTYSYETNDGSELNLPANEYFKTIRKDQNGNLKIALVDKFGRQISDSIPTQNGGQIQNVTLLNYSDTGRRRTQRLPNYFNPPPGSQATDWQRSTVFDMRDQLVSFTEPNSGDTHFIYNQNGLVRFSQNAEQADKVVVLYKKYDAENRVIEEGYFPYTWNSDDLQDKADNDPDWPGSAQAVVPQYKYYYNGDGTNLNDLGHLTMIEVMSKSQADKVEVRINHLYNDRQKLARTEVVLVADAVSFVTMYEYDNLGNVKSTQYPSGTTLTNNRDEVGRVSSIVDGNQKELLEITYNAGDQVLTEINKVIAAAPTTTTYSYNSQGWITGIESPQLTETLTYTANGYQSTGFYDGSVASKTIHLSVPPGSNVPAQLTFKYDYDEAYRVKVAECSTGGQVMAQWSLGLSKPITYDDNGNFLEVDDEQYSYDNGTDFVKNTDGTTNQEYTRDMNGATSSAIPRGITNILRDIYAGKPSSIETESKGTLSFMYDNNNNRVSKKVNGNAEYYGRNSSGTVLTERNIESGSTQLKDFFYGPNGLFGMKTGDELNAVQKDYLKSPRILVDNKGDVVSAYQYKAFGALIDPGESDVQLLRYLFGGYELDGETGLYNAGTRLYDPELRRFYSVDPKLQYASPYLFAGNNPMNMVDLNGESSWWAMLIGAVVGIIATVVTGGAGAVLFGTEIAVSAAVGAVAGTVGALAGDATTAGLSGEKFTAGRALVDALSGFAGGLVGAGVGGLAGRGAMNLAYNAGRDAVEDIAFVTRLGTGVSMVTGGIAGATASSGVTSAMTGQPFFSKETALNIAVGAVAGAGGALMASGAHFGFFGAMPIEMGANDFNRIQATLDIGSTGQRLLTMVRPSEYISTRNNIRALNLGGDDAIFRMSPAGPPNADAIALHGVGRFVFPYTNRGYTQPMSSRLFAQYITTNHPYFNAVAYHGGPVPPLKLSICFSALPGRFGGSVGQTLASALGRTTYAGRGIVYPANLAQNWIRFNP